MAVFYFFLRKRIAKKARQRLKKKLRDKKSKYKTKVLNFVKTKLHITEDSWIYKKYVLFSTPGTFEHFVYTSFLGFVGGILLTYLFFFFFVFQLNFSLTSATILCSIFGIILTLGLAFFMKVRCIVLLLLPQFCSKRGRQALIAYAFILTLTGPLKNTLHNIGVLTESLACGQDQLKHAVKAVVDLIKQPFYSLKDSIAKIITNVKQTVKNIKKSLLAITKLVRNILKVIKGVFGWLASIVNICNKKLGTPFDRCSRAFENGILDCKAKLGSVFGVICNLVYIIKSVCYIVKPFDLICGLVHYVADTVVTAVENELNKFTTGMRVMFYVKVKFSHSFNFETNQSRTFEDVSSGIATEIRQKTEKFLSFFDWMSFFTTFFVFIILLRYKWLTSDRFDNRYITRDVKEIDRIRANYDKETILPLGSRERKKYASLGSFRLIKAEKLKLAKSTIFLSLATFKFIFHIAADYSLYWMLDMIRYHGRIELKIQKPNSVGLHVSGTGFLAELYLSIIKAFSPFREETYVETLPCLPDPTPPDYDRYMHILILIVFCWITTFLEPYGLRLRHVVMNHYHPDRARQRAVWLYNHIIRSRGSFLKFARRQLRRKFGLTNGQPIEEVTLVDRMYTVCPLLNSLFPRKQNICVLCGSVEKKTPHIKCPIPNCVGLYCTECFSDMQNICTICKSPLEYGDYSDLSEEKDSSDENVDVKLFKISSEESSVNATEVMQEERDSDQESLSSYSYQYDYESTSEIAYIPERISSSRDVEAQRFRDDVTTQIFDQVKVKFSEETDNYATDLKSLASSTSSDNTFFDPDISPVESASERETDEDRETDLLLPKKDKNRFEIFTKRVSGMFAIEKPLVKFYPKEERRIETEDTMKTSTSEDSSDETVLLLNVSTEKLEVDDGYLVINNNFCPNSG